MRITWKPCPHITYVSDDENQDGWQYLQVGCPECGMIGANVEDGVVDSSEGLVVSEPVYENDPPRARAEQATDTYRYWLLKKGDRISFEKNGEIFTDIITEIIVEDEERGEVRLVIV